MHLTRITSAKKMGFSSGTLYPKKEAPSQTLHYMKQKSSFFIAVVSLVAFVSGNMIGEHGWYAFWKSVMGKYDDSLIVYTGTVPPLGFVPDYSKWSTYGGNAQEHTYREVPQDLLVPLPAYNQEKERNSTQPGVGGDIYSVGFMGDYATGSEGKGSHPGVDIRVPEGTPVRSIANGFVERVGNDAYGFGLFIVVRHPHAPDPKDPTKTTVLHSVYAHLSSQLVEEGSVVNKGQQIGYSGKTGDATGPHLHFQIDRDEAPWHPYWPFTSQEEREAGLSMGQAINTAFHQERLAEFTVHPMLYVQANYAPIADTPVVVKGSSSSSLSASVITKASSSSSKQSIEKLLLARAASLRALRLKRLALASPAAVVKTQTVAQASTPSLPIIVPVAVVSASNGSQSSVASANSSASSVAASQGGQAVTATVEHDGMCTGRAWETIRIRLKDASGDTADASTLNRDLTLTTAYGEAEFQPKTLSALDFKNGVATVKMLPRGRRTIVINVQPFNALSSPMRFVDE